MSFNDLELIESSTLGKKNSFKNLFEMHKNTVNWKITTNRQIFTINCGLSMMLLDARASL